MEIRELASTLARGLGARGLLNLQLALHDGRLHVLEANPRASRTVPFVAKATGIPLVDHACRLLLGASLAELGLPERAAPTRAWAKEAIFPSERFAGAADRGVEMRSTGEVMASGADPRGRVPPRAPGRRTRACGRRRRRTAPGRPHGEFLRSGSMADPLVRETQKLYGLPLAEFTAARNARAKKLKPTTRSWRHPSPRCRSRRSPRGR